MPSLPAVSPAAVQRLGVGGPLRPIADAVALHKPPLLPSIAVSSPVVPRLASDAHVRGGLL